MPRKKADTTTRPWGGTPATGVQITHNPTTGRATITGSLHEIRQTLGAFTGEGGGGSNPANQQQIGDGGNPIATRKRKPMSAATKEKLRLAAQARQAAGGGKRKAKTMTA